MGLSRHLRAGARTRWRRETAHAANRPDAEMRARHGLPVAVELQSDVRAKGRHVAEVALERAARASSGRAGAEEQTLHRFSCQPRHLLDDEDNRLARFRGEAYVLFDVETAELHVLGAAAD